MKKNKIEKRTRKKIAAILMAAAMGVSGSFGAVPTIGSGMTTVHASDTGYRGYHVSSTTTEKKPATTSTKKSSLSKNHASKTTKTSTETKTNTAWSHVSGKETKKVTKTVTTTTKVYYKKTLTTTVKKQVTITTTNINYVRSGSPDYTKFLGSANTQIPTKIGNAMRNDNVKVVLNSNLGQEGVYSASTKTIQLRKNMDYAFMHEIGHYVNDKEGRVTDSNEFKNIYNSEKGKYKGFYSEYGLDSGDYGRTNASEYFAECFRDYYFSANSRSKLKAACPKTYNFVQKTVANF